MSRGPVASFSVSSNCREDVTKWFEKQKFSMWGRLCRRPAEVPFDRGRPWEPWRFECRRVAENVALWLSFVNTTFKGERKMWGHVPGDGRVVGCLTCRDPVDASPATPAHSDQHVWWLLMWLQICGNILLLSASWSRYLLWLFAVLRWRRCVIINIYLFCLVCTM